MKPGVYPNLSNEAYHSAPGVSKSRLDEIAKSPAIFKAKQEARKNGGGEKEAKHFRTGLGAHVAVLEPDKFSSLYHVSNISRRSNDFELIEKANPDKIIITPAEYDDFMFMAEAVRNEPKAAAILERGYAETSIFHIDEKTGELVKVRPDWFVEDVIADFKTDRAADEDSFSRSCYNYRYFVQAPFYMDVAGAALGRTFNTFAFIVVEKETYQVAVYYADEDMIRLGRNEYRRNLDLYAECRRRDRWPGYNNGEIRPISIPTWAKRRLESAIYDNPTF